ncbi:MAG: 2-succinyl-5-enolpyruvyl-6-hydroxy-3-cyclohexene-1-carboxylic-acid synthase [Parachlamydiaceae bacterium]|nr:2-succinyl-5-enolpyruvyl-6-hydroxy-3-cyclohexene-1-carboxylic-acid synthase [Parachlamydiaceae bacterium]
MNTLQTTFKTIVDSKLVQNILETVIKIGVSEFCICPGARNAALIYPLINDTRIQTYNWPEERSAAFFALGRIKATKRPVAIITTSGTAVGELLPAVMEAYYTGLPLVVISADRPRRFRGSGAPQSAEQVGIFSHYLHLMQDVQSGECVNLTKWSLEGPIQLNVCLEEPIDSECKNIRLSSDLNIDQKTQSTNTFQYDSDYSQFLKKVKFPFIIVGGLDALDREAIINLLLHLQAPVYLEAHSGIREDNRIAHLKIQCVEKVLLHSNKNHYPIDGIFRIGNVPTLRFWRDLEEANSGLNIYSLSSLPFSGLSSVQIKKNSINSFVEWALLQPNEKKYPFFDWHNKDRQLQLEFETLFLNEPLAEPSLIHQLSKKIPLNAKVYLGNSLPIREWDLAATHAMRYYQITASRGMNGIDGQLATFLGYCSDEQDNWAILGDLTTLYDMAAPWVVEQLGAMRINLVVINNQGGAIFNRKFEHPIFQNPHHLSFKPFAEFWNWTYEKWDSIPCEISSCQGARLIELYPNQNATDSFWKSYQMMMESYD